MQKNIFQRSFNPVIESMAKKRHDSVTGFTLVEILIVVIIVGILATFAMPQFAKIKDRAREKEAKAILNLIISAEEVYKTENGSYYSGSSISYYNANLALSIPVNSYWSYFTASRGANGICAIAQNGSNFWHMADTDTEASFGSSCN